jgi:hypothetical protein
MWTTWDVDDAPEVPAVARVPAGIADAHRSGALGRSVARRVFEFRRLVAKQTVKWGRSRCCGVAKHPVDQSRRAVINRELLPAQ